jgi:S-phase kinase-associated protein 1
MAATDNGTFLVQTADNQVVTAPAILRDLSVTIKHCMEDSDGRPDLAVPLHNISAATLQPVFEFCALYTRTTAAAAAAAADADAAAKGKNASEAPKRTAYHAFFEAMSQSLVFELILAANYLDMKPLLDAATTYVGSLIAGKSPEEVRVAFNIKNDFTPEEEEQIMRENEWCVDPHA